MVSHSQGLYTALTISSFPADSIFGSVLGTACAHTAQMWQRRCWCHGARCHIPISWELPVLPAARKSCQQQDGLTH